MHDDAYYAALRKWKAETDYDGIKMFGGWGANATNLKNSLRAFPTASIGRPRGPVASQRPDRRHEGRHGVCPAGKGTKVVHHHYRVEST
ncbi:MAG: hypothetical protein ACLRMJ_05695 [Alistipes finegoldii]